MKTLTNLIVYILFGSFIISCGTGQYLGFKKKKIPLEGKRVSVLKDIKSSRKKVVDLGKIKISEEIVVSEWKQSFNSPLHTSYNYLSESEFNKFNRIISGVGEGDSKKILSQPLVSQNILFFLDADGNVIAYDLKKNKLKWKKSIIIKADKGHNIGGGIAVSDNSIFIGSPYGEIICLDLNDGKTIWKKNTLTPVRATPTVTDNKVVILTLDNRTMVFDVRNGNVIWEHQGISSLTSIIGQPKIAIEGNLLITPYSNGDIFALNLTNGAELWKHTAVSIEKSETSNSFTDIDANPIIFKNLIIIGSTSGKILALNKKNGNQIWEQYLNTTQTPLVNGNSIYVIHNNKEIVCLDIKSGNIRWITTLNKKLSNVQDYSLWLTPVLINSKLIILGGNRNLLILNPYNGDLEKNHLLPNVPIIPPIIVNKRVLLMFKNSDIFYID